MTLHEPLSAEDRLTAAKQAIKDLSVLAEAGARRRGELVSLRQKRQAELAAISPIVGPDNLIIDPADANPAMRHRRVALRPEITELDQKIAHEDSVRRELDPRLEDARFELRSAEYQLDESEVRNMLGTLFSTGKQFRDEGLSCARALILRMQVRYPAHEFPRPGVTFKAHCAAPPIVRLLDLLSDCVENLFQALAEWDKTVVASTEPSHWRAVAVERAEQHGAQATTAAQKRQRDASRNARPAPPPLPPPDIFDVMAENERTVAAREAGAK